MAATSTLSPLVRSQQQQKNGGPNAPVNVALSERLASLAGGSLLAAYGLSRDSFSGLALAAIGGGLVYRGFTGHCHLYNCPFDERHGAIPRR